MVRCLRMVKLPVAALYVFVLFVVEDGARASNFCKEVVEPLGYGCAKFTVQTGDGFVLALHRLSRIKSLIGSGRASAPAVSMSPGLAPALSMSGPAFAPAVRMSPAFAPAPVLRGGDQIVPQYSEGPVPVPSAMLIPSNSVENSTMLSVPLTGSSSASAHTAPSPTQAPEVLGDGSAGVQHSNSANATHRRRRPHYHSGNGSTGAQHSNSTDATHRRRHSHHHLEDGSTGVQHSNSTNAPHGRKRPHHHFGDGSTGVQHSNSTDAMHRRKRPHNHSGDGSTGVQHSNSTDAMHRRKRPHHHSGDGSTGVQHSNSTDAMHRRKRPHHHSGSSPGAPEASGSSNRTSGDGSSEQPVNAAGPAPSTSQNASPSPTQKQRRRTPGGGSSLNHTADLKAGKGSPVLLMHQEFFNGDVWFEFINSENRSSSLLPIMLLNDGFDVWIGHQRATYWSHGHAHLRSTDQAYWNWTWDQHAQYDLSAQLLFISTETNQPVHFIGVSQAATVGAAAATDHEIAQMIRSMTLIGPTAHRGYTSSLLLEAWAYFFGATTDSEYYATGFQNGAFNYSSEFPMTGPLSSQGISNTVIDLVSGPNCCLGSEEIRFINGWDGTTSFKNLLHWQQGIRTNNFAHYDYGSPARNMQAYGQATPPAYNVGLIPRRLPILIVGGGMDWFAPPQGIRLLLSQLQQQATFINLTNYAHYDFGFSVRRDRDIYLPILKYLEGPKFH